MNRRGISCPHARIWSRFVFLKLGSKRRPKGQRYYPRPPKPQAVSSFAGENAARPSCLAICVTQPAPAL